MSPTSQIEPVAPRAPRLLAALCACALALGGCAVGPNYKRAPAAVPEHYKNVATQPANPPPQPPPDAWWTLFEDPMLNDLILQVEVSNQNLAAATAAYDQAVAAVNQARASFFPLLSADVNANRINSGGHSTASSTITTGGIAVNTPGTSGSASTVYQATGSASWEIDVWGKLRRTLENASETAHAELADLAAARLSAQSQLAIAYLQLREADAERRLVTATTEAYDRTLQITINRYHVGMAPKTDVLQAETQLYNAQQQEAALRLSRAQLENAVAALVGKPASDFRIAERDTWNIPVPQIPAGVPSTLLERRPDIVAAEHQVAAASANIGVQEAAYFPSLTLTGTVGFVSSSLPMLFEVANRTTSAGLGASGTVFDFGLTRARVAQARGAYRQALATWRETILTAFQSVENYLVSADLDHRQTDLLRKASDAADENERLVLNEYKAGTVDFTTVVVAQAAALSARRSLAQSVVSEQANAVSLVTALGGGWTAAR